MLSHLRVVEVSAFVAAPLAGATLAGLGADVIRVEQLGGGPDAGRWPLHEGRSLYRAGLDRGKQSVALDLRSPAGQALAQDLIVAPGDGAGILVTNLPAAGWMEYEQLAARRPDLIMVTISGTSDGTAAVDYTVNAGIGFPWVTGPDGWSGPVNHVLPAWDLTTGLMAALGVDDAERHRGVTGEGQLVELALAEVAMSLTGNLGFLAEAALVERPRARYGNDLFGSYAHDFRTRDGKHIIVLAMTRKQWRKLVAATDTGETFQTFEQETGANLDLEGDRFEHREKLTQVIGSWIAERTFRTVRAEFDAAGVLWGPYRTFKEFVAEVPTASDPPPSPLHFSAHPSPPSGSFDSPEIGADTKDVLAAVLKVTPDGLNRLQEDGVIG